ncbi:uncharacterized protein [Nerophis lumbriciformis]|uniref:uncharacterized protein isoform X3 n=1 Tax=Nerophis lumbriciformis TaxID=546530 RepID=UPI003BAD383C
MNMIVFFLLAVQMHSVVSVNHSLRHIQLVYYRDSQLKQYVDDGTLDGQDIFFYRSKNRQVEPVQDWMRKITAEDPQYWQRETKKAVVREQFLTNRFETYLKDLNQTEGDQVAVWFSGCKWNDETDEVTGWYMEDMEFTEDENPMKRWTAAKDQGDHIKLIWDDDKAPPDTFMFDSEECPSYLKMLVSILTRTELPKVSLLQETPSSPASCNATGFYPDKAVMFWRKDGERLHEGVDHGEMLQDGTFQMSVDLNVTADMEGKYECVFQLTGVKEDIVTELESRSILSNASGEDLNTTISGNNSQATSWPTTITIRPTTSGTSNDNQTTTWPNTTIEGTTRPSLNNSDATPPTPGHMKSTDHLEDLNTTISGNNSQATSRPTTITIRPTTNGTSNDNQTTTWPNTTIEATTRPSLNNSDATPPTPGHNLNTTISGNNSQATSWPTTITIRPTTSGTSNDNQTTTWPNTTIEATTRPSLNNSDATPPTPGHNLNTTISGNNSQATSWPTTITIRPTTRGTSNDNQTTTWPNTTIEATTRPSLNNSDATPPTPGHMKSTDHLEDLNSTISGNNSQATSRPTTITIRPTTNGTSNDNQTTTWPNTTIEATTRPSLNNSDATPPTPGHNLNTIISGENSQATSRPTTITIRPTTSATTRPSLNNFEPTPRTPGHIKYTDYLEENLSVKVAVVTVGVVAGAVLLSAIIFGIVKRYRHTHGFYWVNRPTESWVTVAMRHLSLTRSESDSESESESE